MKNRRSFSRKTRPTSQFPPPSHPEEMYSKVSRVSGKKFTISLFTSFAIFWKNWQTLFVATVLVTLFSLKKLSSFILQKCELIGRKNFSLRFFRWFWQKTFSFDLRLNFTPKLWAVNVPQVYFLKFIPNFWKFQKVYQCGHFKTFHLKNVGTNDRKSVKKFLIFIKFLLKNKYIASF